MSTLHHFTVILPRLSPTDFVGLDGDLALAHAFRFGGDDLETEGVILTGDQHVRCQHEVEACGAGWRNRRVAQVQRLQSSPLHRSIVPQLATCTVLSLRIRARTLLPMDNHVNANVVFSVCSSGCVNRALPCSRSERDVETIGRPPWYTASRAVTDTTVVTLGSGITDNWRNRKVVCTQTLPVSHRWRCAQRDWCGTYVGHG